MSSESEFAPFLKYNTCFIVRNICPDHRKTIKIFHYPINWGQTRDLLQIPGVQEADIRASLLKGELRHKFLCGDIELVCSEIDLLQFSSEQKEFLQNFGFTVGVEIGSDQISPDAYVGSNYLWREKIPLIGIKNAINRTFYTPEKFINGLYSGNIFNIAIEHNGKALYENIDFTIGESSGPGTGYDTINLISFAPNIHSVLYATYVVRT